MSQLFLGLVVLSMGVIATASDVNNSPTVVEIVLKYNPSIPVSAIAAGTYLAVAAALLAVIFWGRNWWGLCLPIGAICESLGFISRIILTRSPNNLSLLINMELFIVCSPAAFLAFNYILFGRFVRMCVGRQHSIIRPEIVSTVFVVSDISTFLVQTSGGSLQTEQSLVILGEKILLIGLILQGISYLVFCCLFVHVHWSIRKDDSVTGNEAWWKILWAFYISSIFIAIRCVYRITEVGQGIGGYLMSHEMYFYLLDTLPLLIAIGIYVPYWPGRFIKGESPDCEMAESRSI